MVDAGLKKKSKRQESDNDKWLSGLYEQRESHGTSQTPAHMDRDAGEDCCRIGKRQQTTRLTLLDKL